jgi:hypothetical protein
LSYIIIRFLFISCRRPLRVRAHLVAAAPAVLFRQQEEVVSVSQYEHMIESHVAVAKYVFSCMLPVSVYMTCTSVVLTVQLSSQFCSSLNLIQNYNLDGNNIVQPRTVLKE